MNSSTSIDLKNADRDHVVDNAENYQNVSKKDEKMTDNKETDQKYLSVVKALSTYTKKCFLVQPAVNYSKRNKLEKMANEDELILDVEKTSSKNKKYIATEKVDGSNCSVEFITKKGIIICTRFFKRGSEIRAEIKPFVDFFPAFENYVSQFHFLIQYLSEKYDIINNDSLCSIVVVGEFYHKNVINRINYNNPKPDLLFYQICLNGKKIPFVETHQYLQKSFLPTIPIIATGNLDELFQKLSPLVDTNHSLVSKENANKYKIELKTPVIAEGFVLHPVEKGKLYKLRCSLFLENKKNIDKKNNSENKQLPVDNFFVSYFDEHSLSNRITNYYSKVDFSEFSDLNKTANFVVEDVIEDIAKIKGKLSSKEEKYVRNSIYNLVMKLCKDKINSN